MMNLERELCLFLHRDYLRKVNTNQYATINPSDSLVRFDLSQDEDFVDHFYPLFANSLGPYIPESFFYHDITCYAKPLLERSYIDGFNFYFGLKRTKHMDPTWKNFYWIDMIKLCESILGEGQILEKVIYFTASPLSQQKNSRQSAFLNTNKLINGNRFEIVRGKYLEKHIICPYCKGDISRPEEKKTDVNISIRMIEDCVMNATDIVALVSADSDLVPPIELIQRRFPNVGIKVYFPPSNFSNDLKDNLIHHRSKPILMIKNLRRFQTAVMPDIITKDGKTFTIPEKWK